jgi:hypothetical protein
MRSPVRRAGRQREAAFQEAKRRLDADERWRDERTPLNNSVVTAKLARVEHVVGNSGSYLDPANTVHDADRAVSGAAVKTRTLDGYHLKLGSIGNDHVRDNIDGAKLQNDSIPSDKINALKWGKLADVPDFSARMDQKDQAIKQEILAHVKAHYRRK